MVSAQGTVERMKCARASPFQSKEQFCTCWACCACFGTVETFVIELRTRSEILSKIFIMTRKSNSNSGAKSLQEENEALNEKEIEELKSEFKRILSELKSHESSHGVLPCKVKAEINSLTPIKALGGLYSCPVRILKVERQALSTPLAFLLNKSVQRGIYPSTFSNSLIIH